MIPDSWSLDLFSAFLVNALRRLVRDRSESSVARALNGAQNLKTGVRLIEKMEQLGPTVEATR